MLQTTNKVKIIQFLSDIITICTCTCSRRVLCEWSQCLNKSQAPLLKARIKKHQRTDILTVSHTIATRLKKSSVLSQRLFSVCGCLGVSVRCLTMRQHSAWDLILRCFHFHCVLSFKRWFTRSTDNLQSHGLLSWKAQCKHVYKKTFYAYIPRKFVQGCPVVYQHKNFTVLKDLK